MVPISCICGPDGRKYKEEHKTFRDNFNDINNQGIVRMCKDKKQVQRMTNSEKDEFEEITRRIWVKHVLY